MPETTNRTAQRPQDPPEEQTPPQDTTGAPDGAQRSQDGPEPESFPRAYVEELRQENARYRTRAQQADAYAQRLHTALVTATGRLADPTDLPFDAAHVDDEAALAAAIDALLARKPHLASRTPRGDVGQGATPTGQTVDLAGLLRARAG